MLEADGAEHHPGAEPRLGGEAHEDDDGRERRVDVEPAAKGP